MCMSEILMHLHIKKFLGKRCIKEVHSLSVCKKILTDINQNVPVKSGLLCVLDSLDMGGGVTRKGNRGVNSVKVSYMHVWK
jgi:hypothetical protein